jgi:hypothetical protein
LVETSLPQALEMKGNGHDDIVFTDIEGLMAPHGHEGPQGLAGMKAALVFEPLNGFEE